jgi:hypothetical protein
MKNQIILLSLAVSGLLISAHSALSATSLEVTQLSRNITSLVDLDSDHQNLLEKAIDRVLVAQQTAQASKQIPGHVVRQDSSSVVNTRTGRPIRNEPTAQSSVVNESQSSVILAGYMPLTASQQKQRDQLRGR